MKFDISETILKEITAESKQTYLTELAMEILHFELENWRKEKPRYTSDYEKMIEKAVRRKETEN